MIKPQRLKPNDLVGIISPSLPVYSKQNLSRGIKNLESLGIKSRLSPHALEVYANYQAGTAENRVHDLHSMFLDDEVKAIFCTDGGYAGIQLLPEIDWDLIKKNPKIFIGHSDITLLITAMSEKSDLVTFHGLTIEDGLHINPETKGAKFTLKSLKNTLMKGEAGSFPSFTEWKTLRPGRAEGTLLGGNLNALLSLMGTPYEPKWDGKILFWEEVDETIEGLDNYLWRLRLAKVFKKIEGMVVGKITNLRSIDEESEKLANMDKPPTIEDVLLRATEGYNFPILYGADFGHDVPSLTIPVGAKALLDCPARGRVGKFSVTEKYLSD